MKCPAMTVLLCAAAFASDCGADDGDRIPRSSPTGTGATGDAVVLLNAKAGIARANETMARTAQALMSIARDENAERESRRKAIFLLVETDRKEAFAFLIENVSLRLPMRYVLGDLDMLKETPCLYALGKGDWHVAKAILQACSGGRSKEDAALLESAVPVILGRRLAKAARPVAINERPGARVDKPTPVTGKGRPSGRAGVLDPRRPETWRAAVRAPIEGLKRITESLLALAMNRQANPTKRAEAIGLLAKIGSKESRDFLIANIALRLPLSDAGDNVSAPPAFPCRDALLKGDWNSAHAVLKALNRPRPGNDLIHCAKVLVAILGRELAIAAIDYAPLQTTAMGIWRRNLNAVKSYLTQ